MKFSLFVAFISFFAFVSAQNFVSEVDMYMSVDDFRACEMSPTGQIGLKICGDDTCCYKNHLGSVFLEGAIHRFTGPEQLGECYELDLGNLVAGSVNVGIYHSGTDAVCFERVRFFMTNGKFSDCNFNNTLLDSNQYLISQDCIVV